MAEHHAIKATAPKGRLSNSCYDRGFNAERVPLSGAAGGSYLGDLTRAHP